MVKAVLREAAHTAGAYPDFCSIKWLGVDLDCSSPLRGTDSKTEHLSYFSAKYPKRYHKSSHCGPF